jgi:hypothetical protein
MPPARCSHHEHPPGPDCCCGYHAAYDPWELASQFTCPAGLLVVQAAGPTFWHANAWRASAYVTHAAIVNLEWSWPDEWDDEVPVVRAEWADIPLRAWEIAEEVRLWNRLDRVL